MPPLDTRDPEADAPPARYSWPVTLALFLLPGAATTAFALLMRPVVAGWGFPPETALTISPVILFFECVYLLVRGRRRNGRLSLAGVVGYRRRLRAWKLAALVVGLLATATVLGLAMAPIGDYLAAHVFRGVASSLGDSSPQDLHRLSMGAVAIYFGLILLLQAILIWVMVWFRDLRISILCHAVANIAGTVLSLLAFLGA